MSNGLFDRLPAELLTQVLRHLRPSGRLTIPKLPFQAPEMGVHPNHVESRKVLATLCLVSRLFYSLSTGCLYQAVRLNDTTELLLFFRTLLEHPDRAAIVRSFACLDLFRGGLFSHNLDRQVFRELDHLWVLIASHLSDPSFSDVIQSVGIASPENVAQPGKILAVIMAMMSNMQSLFILLRSHSDSPNASRALSALQPWTDRHEFAFWRWLAGVDHRATVHGTSPTPPESAPCRRFLRFLNVIVMETRFAAPHLREAPEEVWLALLSHPRRLHRLELNGTLLPRGGLPPAASAAAQDVKELHLHRDVYVPGELTTLVEAFPNLTSLKAEYRNPYRSFTTHSSGLNEASSALAQLSKTLVTLTLTSGLNSWPHVLMTGNALPILTRLGDLTRLKHLTTESIFLFGRADGLSTHLQPVGSAALPPSLATLHLIDFWGIGKGVPSSSRALQYYPEFEDRTPIQFYEHQVSLLYSQSLPNLQELVFSTDWSKLSASEGGLELYDISTAVKFTFSAKFSRLFDTVGVRFSLLDIEDMEEVHLRSEWTSRRIPPVVVPFGGSREE